MALFHGDRSDLYTCSIRIIILSWPPLGPMRCCVGVSATAGTGVTRLDSFQEPAEGIYGCMSILRQVGGGGTFSVGDKEEDGRIKGSRK